MTQTASTTHASQEKVCGYEYTVKRGDSFYLIAHRLGVPLRDLLEANANINPARLMVGDVLCIPMEEDDEPTPEMQTPAQTPETMPSLPDEEEDLDAPAADLNQPASPDDGIMDDDMAVCPEANRYTVQPGETIADIQLNAGLSLHTLQTVNPSTDLDQLTQGQVLCVPEENVPCPTAATYILRTGENLDAVALRLNVSIASLLRANPCLAPADFVPGMCIAVPQ